MDIRIKEKRTGGRIIKTVKEEKDRKSKDRIEMNERQARREEKRVKQNTKRAKQRE